MDLVLHNKRQKDLCFVQVGMLVTHFSSVFALKEQPWRSSGPPGWGRKATPKAPCRLKHYILEYLYI